MIKLTRLDGSSIYLNEINIQWIEALPDTTITILSGARLIVKETIEDILKLIEEKLKQESKFTLQDDSQNMNELSTNFPYVAKN